MQIEPREKLYATSPQKYTYATSVSVKSVILVSFTNRQSIDLILSVLEGVIYT